MPEKKTAVNEDVERRRRVFLATEDGRRTLAEIGRELGAFTYAVSTDPAEIVKLNVWKWFLGRLGILNAADLNQCLFYVQALSEIPPVREGITEKEEDL